MENNRAVKEEDKTKAIDSQSQLSLLVVIVLLTGLSDMFIYIIYILENSHNEFCLNFVLKLFLGAPNGTAVKPLTHSG